MVSILRNVLVALAVSGSVASAASMDQHPIAFKVHSSAGALPIFSADPWSKVAQANDAFLAKYGVENGLLGTVVGSRGELLVLVARQIHMNQIWRKMVGAGDAFSSRGVGYFRFESNAAPEPTVPYTYLGKVTLEEGQSGQLVIPNGTPEITGYKLAMDHKCGIAGSGVVLVHRNMPLIPTRLVNSERVGSYTIAYNYEVNGGQGALLSSIAMTLARRGGPFVVDICPIDVYVRF
jgi:hypothetical protein